MTTNLNHSAYPFFGEIDTHKWRMPGETKREKWAAQFMAALISSHNFNGQISDIDLAEIAIAKAVALETALNEITVEK